MLPKMNRKHWTVLAIIGLSLVLAACGGTSEEEAAGGSESETATPAMVDSVAVEQRDSHSYAVVAGNYPDACSRISGVQQDVEGSTINITLMTDRPADLMCATMLSPFTVDILLATGGLMPQEYTVTVNDGASATLSLQ
jgi:hypothetical protein